MIKIIGIGGCGNNILEHINKQNLDKNYDCFTIKSSSDLNDIQISQSDVVFTVSGFGGKTAGGVTLDVTKELISKNIKVKNIIVLPFSSETTNKNLITDLETLVSINQNIEVLANDDILKDRDSEMAMSEIMKIYDEVIYEFIKKSNHVDTKSFFIERKKDNKTYKAIVKFWSKSYKITLLEPLRKMIHQSSIGNIANHRYDFKNNSDKYVIDIEKIANDKIDEYIL